MSLLFSLFLHKLCVRQAHLARRRYLPGTQLPDNVIAIPDLTKACEGADLLIFVLPHQVSGLSNYQPSTRIKKLMQFKLSLSGKYAAISRVKLAPTPEPYL
jgi:hypothetical protein